MHDTCGKCVRYHLGQIFQNEAKSIIQRSFPFREHQPVYSFIIIGDVHTESWNSEIIPWIVEISFFVKSFFVVGILFQAVDQSPGIFAGAQNGIGEISKRPFPGGNDREIHADQHHGIGDDTVCQFHKFHYGSISEAGIDKGLVPLVINKKYLLQLIENCINRNVLRNHTQIRLGQFVIMI